MNYNIQVGVKQQYILLCYSHINKDLLAFTLEEAIFVYPI